MADNEPRYTLIPGTNWGLCWSTQGAHSYPVVSKRIPAGKRKGGEIFAESWGRPAYCVDIAQAAQIISADIGAGPLVDMLQRIVEAESRLTAVLEALMQHGTETPVSRVGGVSGDEVDIYSSGDFSV